MNRWMFVVVFVLLPQVAWAVPGPESVAVIANANVPGSIMLAERYRAARDIPHTQVCLFDLPTDHTIDVAVFQAQLVDQLGGCLGAVWDRIEAIVLVRGVPQRVTTSGGRASLAAALQVVGSVTSSDAMALIEQSPGVRTNCGNSPCTAARWRNPYTAGPFRAGFERTFAGVDYQLRLVTALDGRSDEDAARLIASATTADAIGGATGEFLFMDGADGARGVLDREYPSVIAALESNSLTANRVPFDRNATGHRLAAFFVGTANLGDTIEGNDFEPGALVDNLTSFGAVPDNFLAPDQERQVSIARWVAKGVAGVHGTTDEPLNNCFPSRDLIVDYVGGYTLAESFQKNMPFVYWRNLVLGDPIVAPYAVRPEVRFENITDGDAVDGARMLGVLASDPNGRPLRSLALYVDGELVEQTVDDVFLVRCQTWAGLGETQLLAVAQVADDPQTKGWAAITIDVRAGPTDCTTPPVDAGVIDAGTRDAGVVPPRDAGVAPVPIPEADEGCSCHAARPRTDTTNVMLVVGVILCCRRRRR